MSLTVDFDAIPRNLYVPTATWGEVRFIDKTIATIDSGSPGTSYVVYDWYWKLHDDVTWTVSTPPSTRLNITNANLYFKVDDVIGLANSGGSLPTGLSSGLGGSYICYYVVTATSTYLEISATKGGAAVQYTAAGSGTNSIYHVGNRQSPVISIHPVSTKTTYTVTLAVCSFNGGWYPTTCVKTAFITVDTGAAFTPPAQTTAYRNVTIFVYERSSETAPKGTCICRAKTSACNLFFMNLQANGSMLKAGKATFDIVNGGGGTANEIDLFESTTVGRYKNVAIIGGYDVIWSGKITKSQKELMSQPGTSPQKAIYHCEAFSDAYKMADWNIPAANRGTKIGLTPGYLASLILTANSGEPDFIGTKGGVIDYTGACMQMTLNDIDKYTAFSTLTGATDYDWRTRMETMLFQYATFNGTNLVTITSAGLTAGVLVGSWILFPTENLYNGGSPIPNRVGIVAWGRITGNSATTITASGLSGAANVPLATDNCLIVQVPRLDFASDLTEPAAVRAFTNGTNVVRFKNEDEKVDLFTKVTAKGKNLLATNMNGQARSITAALSATDTWNTEKNFFDKSSMITQQTDGYVYSYVASANSIILIGQGYVLQVGDIFFVYATLADGSNPPPYGPKTITSVSPGETQPDGTPTTTVSFSGYLDTQAFMKYSIFICTKTYVKDSANISSAFPASCRIGTEKRYFQSASSDWIYGRYLLITAYGQIGYGDTPIYPHKPGCLVAHDLNTEASPATGSPVQVHGIISKPLTVDTDTTVPDLEVAATAALLQGSQYYQKSTMQATWFQFTNNRVRDGVQLTGPAMIREGQRISVVPYTGASAIERQVIEWRLDARTMILSITMGDYEKDVWNSLDRNTSATQKVLI